MGCNMARTQEAYWGIPVLDGAATGPIVTSNYVSLLSILMARRSPSNGSNLNMTPFRLLSCREHGTLSIARYSDSVPRLPVTGRIQNLSWSHEMLLSLFVFRSLELMSDPWWGIVEAAPLRARMVQWCDFRFSLSCRFWKRRAHILFATRETQLHFS